MLSSLKRLCFVFLLGLLAFSVFGNEDGGSVVFVRPRQFLGTSADFYVVINQQLSLTLKPGEFAKLSLAPGEYLAYLSFDSEKSVVEAFPFLLQIQANQEHVYRLESRLAPLLPKAMEVPLLDWTALTPAEEPENLRSNP
ncbi:MAG: hypothetical protein MI717_15725 [Spirochaetales bacterium]|nr:hypothetical protein [Spirochaetales bacterium]